MSHTLRLGGVMLVLVVASVLGATEAPPASAASPGPEPLSPEAEIALHELVAFHAGAVRLNELAEGRGALPNVRDLATLGRRDHAFALRRLTDLADDVGVRVDGDVGPASSWVSVERLGGATFDRTWLELLEERQEELLRRVPGLLAGVPDGELHALLAAQAPILRQHLALVHHVRREVEAAGEGP